MNQSLAGNFEQLKERIIGVEVFGRSPTYIATGPGWVTGQSYAIVAFVQNPDHSGQVLLLAGEDGERTEAAVQLVTDLPRFSAALQALPIVLKETEYTSNLLSGCSLGSHAE